MLNQAKLKSKKSKHKQKQLDILNPSIRWRNVPFHCQDVAENAFSQHRYQYAMQTNGFVPNNKQTFRFVLISNLLN